MPWWQSILRYFDLCWQTKAICSELSLSRLCPSAQYSVTEAAEETTAATQVEAAGQAAAAEETAATTQGEATAAEETAISSG